MRWKTDSRELLSTLQDICNYLANNCGNDPEKVLGYALGKTVRLAKAMGGNIRCYDSISRSLELKACFGSAGTVALADPFLPLSSSIEGKAFEKGEICAVGDLLGSSRHGHTEYDVDMYEGVGSLIAVPLSDSGKMGVISMYYSRPRKFTAEEKHFYGIIADFFVSFFHTCFLRHELKQSYLKTVEVLVTALEEKDSCTSGHSARVRQYALMIAEAMELPQETVSEISEIAILHDIGKIIMSDSVLKKSGGLNESEWEIVKKHPLYGAKILSPIEDFDLALHLVKYHHERMDGKGYPEGLSGDSIPLIARIIAVADAYDAMNSCRPYRNRFTIEQIKEELLENAGTQFDRDVVKVFLRLLEQHRLSFPQSIAG